MHELSLCRSIYGIADRARAGRRVDVIHLQVGQLRQVVPETLRYCWGLVTETTELAGSRLDIDHVAGELVCDACGATTTVQHALILTCADCGSGRTRVSEGEEFMLTSMDLHPRDPDGCDMAGHDSDTRDTDPHDSDRRNADPHESGRPDSDQRDRDRRAPDARDPDRQEPDDG